MLCASPFGGCELWNSDVEKLASKAVKDARDEEVDRLKENVAAINADIQARAKAASELLPQLSEATQSAREETHRAREATTRAREEGQKLRGAMEEAKRRGAELTSKTQDFQKMAERLKEYRDWTYFVVGLLLLLPSLALLGALYWTFVYVVLRLRPRRGGSALTGPQTEAVEAERGANEPIRIPLGAEDEVHCFPGYFMSFEGQVSWEVKALGFRPIQWLRRGFVFLDRFSGEGAGAAVTLACGVAHRWQRIACFEGKVWDLEPQSFVAASGHQPPVFERGWDAERFFLRFELSRLRFKPTREERLWVAGFPTLRRVDLPPGATLTIADSAIVAYCNAGSGGKMTRSAHGLTLRYLWARRGVFLTQLQAPDAPFRAERESWPVYVHASAEARLHHKHSQSSGSTGYLLDIAQLGSS